MSTIHAVATGDPRRLRWVLPAGHRLPVGTVRGAPGRLGDWLADGLVAELVIRGDDALITLGAGGDWRSCGDTVRDALQHGATDPTGWCADDAGAEAGLAAAVRELLAGPVGAVAASHGGAIELVAVDGDVVTVAMSGACDGCPASGSTLYDNLQRELRRRLGDQVRVAAAPAAPRRRRLRRPR